MVRMESRPSCATMPSCSAPPRCCASARDRPRCRRRGQRVGEPLACRTDGRPRRGGTADPRRRARRRPLRRGRDRLHRLRRAVDTASTRRARPLATGAGNRLRDRSRARRLPVDRPVARRRDHDRRRGDRSRDFRRVVVGERRQTDRRGEGDSARFRSSPAWSSSSPAWRRSPAAPAGSATSGRPRRPSPSSSAASHLRRPRPRTAAARLDDEQTAPSGRRSGRSSPPTCTTRCCSRSC